MSMYVCIYVGFLMQVSIIASDEATEALRDFVCICLSVCVYFCVSVSVSVSVCVCVYR